MALNEDGWEQAGMGSVIGDFDTDGILDIFKTHFSADTNILYHNNGKGIFRDATNRGRSGVETRFVGWGAAMEDFDNDGLPDLFFATGMVYPEVERQGCRMLRIGRRMSCFAIWAEVSLKNSSHRRGRP